MLTEKDYCDYDTCVALKELGFDEKCLAYYDSEDNVGLLYNEEYSSAFYSVQYTDLLESHNVRPDGCIDAPTLYEAQKWLREGKEVYVTVIPEYNEFSPIKGVKYRLEVAHWKDDEFGYETIEWLDEECPYTIITFDSYEEALSEGIKGAVKILKEK